MSKEELKNDLITDVVDQIKDDIDNDFYDAIDELLTFVPIENLVGYLPEKMWMPYLTLISKSNENGS